MLKFSRFAVAAAIAGVAFPLSAQVVISTPAYPGRQIGMFNNSLLGSQVIGQTITTPTGMNSLDSFVFQLNAHPLYSSNITFAAFVGRWDAVNEKIVGDLLWKGGARNGIGVHDVSTGGIGVVAGEQYLVGFTTDGYLDTHSYLTSVLVAYGWNDYAGGRFYGKVSGPTDAVQPFSRDLGCGDCDATFTARFSDVAPVQVVPEPSSLALATLGLGLAALGRQLRRRTRR